jgi:VIT1/CCC1 family predicted Fe2+/Mn2+ transporter
MESHRDQIDFAAELRALRPTPRPTFAAQLDARVAAGFMPDAEGAGSPLSRIAVRLRAFQGHGLKMPRGRGLLLPAGALATLAIAASTAVVVISEGGSSEGVRVASIPKSNRAKVPPTALSAPAQATPGSASAPSSATAEAPAGGENASVPARGIVAPNPESISSAKIGPYAIGVAHRNIERSAQIVLGDDPEDVRGDAAKVFDAVQAYHGIVLRSSISDGGEGEAGATFNLLIPSGKLGEAMAAFSAIADVRARHESSVDVTAPTISLGERLQDARAKVDSLLAEVAGAETEAEREAAEAKLQAARHQVATLRSRLVSLQRRTHLSSVLLRIETNGAADEGSGSWGIGDGVHEAGHILAVAAGVTVIGLAIVAPLALIVLLIWLVRRTWITRSRERALD